MAKTVEIKFNTFYGGVSDDPRENSSTEFIISKHFDIFSNPNRLTPYRSFEADTNDGTSATGMKIYKIEDFLYAATSSKFYGLGQSTNGFTRLFYKNDAPTGNWIKPGGSTGNKTVQNGCLVEYKDYLWGFQGTTSVWRYGTLSGVPTISNEIGTVGTVFNTVTGVTIAAGGTDYNVNDILTIIAGNNTCKVIVTAITAGGVVSAISILEPGYNQKADTGIATAVVPSGGADCTLNISTVADVSEEITSIAQGVIAKDDNLYLPYNNILVRVYPSGTVQDQALKLPTNLKITSICNWGNYLAIGCAPKDKFNGVSKVFLWNLTSPDVQEVLDWGEGELRVLENIEGMLVGVSDRYLNNVVGAGQGSMIIQGYTGGYPQVLKEVFTEKLTGITIPSSKTVKNNRLFFVAKIFSSDTEYNEGIWSFGRKNQQYPFALSLDYIDENVTTAGIQAFGAAGNYMFLSHSDDGSIDKINDTNTYSFTSIYEPQIIDFEDIDNDKRLNKVQVSFVRLTTGQSVTLKYKVDEASSWTTIGTFNTVGKLSHTFVREETNNKDFASGREFRLQIESDGGAEITGLRAEATFFNEV